MSSGSPGAVERDTPVPPASVAVERSNPVPAIGETPGAADGDLRAEIARLLVEEFNPENLDPAYRAELRRHGFNVFAPVGQSAMVTFGEIADVLVAASFRRAPEDAERLSAELADLRYGLALRACTAPDADDRQTRVELDRDRLGGRLRTDPSRATGSGWV